MSPVKNYKHNGHLKVKQIYQTIRRKYKAFVTGVRQRVLGSVYKMCAKTQLLN